MAVKFLYLCELNAGEWKEQLEQFWERNPCQKDIMRFSEGLLKKVFEHRDQIDELVEKFSDHFALSRMGVIDRNLLRLAVTEILYAKETPAAVVINEAVEIAKRYGSDESPAFINGVLDKIKGEIEGGRVIATPAS